MMDYYYFIIICQHIFISNWPSCLIFFFILNFACPSQFSSIICMIDVGASHVSVASLGLDLDGNVGSLFSYFLFVQLLSFCGVLTLLLHTA